MSVVKKIFENPMSIYLTSFLWKGSDHSLEYWLLITVKMCYVKCQTSSFKIAATALAVFRQSGLLLLRMAGYQRVKVLRKHSPLKNRWGRHTGKHSLFLFDSCSTVLTLGIISSSVMRNLRLREVLICQRSLESDWQWQH